jgi:hypothetical protein
VTAGPLLVGAEGVLLVPEEDEPYASSRPVLEGIELVMQLKHFPTSNTTIIVHTQDVEGAAYFIKINGLPETGCVPTALEDKYEEPAMAQWYAIERQRAMGPVRFVVTAYKEVYERCLISHQPVLLFGRMGSVGSLDGPVPWEDLHARIQRQRDAKVEALDEDERRESITGQSSVSVGPFDG